MKVEITANYYMGFHASRLVTYLSVLVALVVALFAAFLAKELDLYPFLFGVIGSELLIVYVLGKRVEKFKKEVKYLDQLIEELDDNKPLGTLENIIDKAPK